MMSAIAQVAHFKQGDAALKKFLQQKLSTELRKHNVGQCIISATFAKFSIDASGNIIDLKISENKNTPPLFREMLTSVINATAGLWIPAQENGQPVVSKPFLLPLVYEMEANCGGSGRVVDNGTATSLLGLLSFDNDKDPDLMDCVIISPLNIFSQN